MFLETNRLILRKFQDEDFADFFSILPDSAVFVKEKRGRFCMGPSIINNFYLAANPLPGLYNR